MRRAEPWLIAISLLAGMAVGAPRASAQPDVRDHHPSGPPPGHPSEHDRRRPPPPGNEPSEAPPTPREERQAARAGFVWIPGRWDWRGKWEWIDGRWEKEHTGKRWNPGRWDKRGDHWVYAEGDWVDAGAAPSEPRHDRPSAPPPPPRDERPAARAGFVFVHGRWDWRDGKWEWLDGRWEKERAGHQWREARWELRDGTYALVDGEWVNVGPAGSAPPPPSQPSDEPRHHEHRTWRVERPTVSSYWPVKGKVGSRIVIRGRNFPSTTAVMWGDQQINGAKVTPEEIVVAVPPGATSSTLLLRTGDGPRALIVGNFEVADNYDAAAEAARQADEARKRAEAQWAERQRTFAKDRAARRAAYEQREHERDETREQRRAARLAELRGQWQAAFLADPSTQDELTLHAQRSADLERMKEVAELSENGKLVVRIGVLQSREDDRHQARMTALHDAFRRNP